MGRNDCFYSQLPDIAWLAIPSGMADGLAQTSSTDFPCRLLLAGLPLFHVINVDHVVTLRPSLSDEIP
jgi:hypothetical protein